MSDLAGPTYSKVDQVKLAHAHVHVPVHPLLTALDGDSEDGVGTRAVLVHVCGTNRTCEQREKATLSSEGITSSSNTLLALKGDSPPSLYPTLFFTRGVLKLSSKLYS